MKKNKPLYKWSLSSGGIFLIYISVAMIYQVFKKPSEDIFTNISIISISVFCIYCIIKFEWQYIKPQKNK